MMGYPSERLFEEVAYISYYFHWPYDQVMALEHRERRRWACEIARIHRKMAQSQGSDPLVR